jgi:PPM family protein phosphatase
MADGNDHVTIGAFARRAHLTTKALRVYDDARLLRPVDVDPTTGYRRYALTQLHRAAVR